MIQRDNCATHHGGNHEAPPDGLPSWPQRFDTGGRATVEERPQHGNTKGDERGQQHFEHDATRDLPGKDDITLMQEDAWVPMIPVDRATGAEADLYGGQAVGNVVRAMSLVPDEVRTLYDLSAAHYLPMGQVRDPSASTGALNRMQMELIAGRVSALRQCFY